MGNEDSDQRFIDIIFVGMYLIIGSVWLAFYLFQGEDIIFNTSYDYKTLIMFQVVSGLIIIGYTKLSPSLWVRCFLCISGLMTIPLFVGGYRRSMDLILIVDAFMRTRLIVLLVHITIYAVIAIELLYKWKSKLKERLI